MNQSMMILSPRLQQGLLARLLDTRFEHIQMSTSNTIAHDTHYRIDDEVELVGYWRPDRGLRPLAGSFSTPWEACYEANMRDIVDQQCGSIVLKHLLPRFNAVGYLIIPLGVFDAYLTWMGDMADAA